MKKASAALATLLSASVISASALAGEPLKVIYSNFDPDPAKLYYCCGGFTVSTPSSEVGQRVSVAMPFAPVENGSIKKIRLAVGHASGANSLSVSLRADDGGLPGAVIKRFQVFDLAEFGSCCETEVVTLKGVPVTAGTTYWVVVKADADTWAGWNSNSVGAVGLPAFNQGEGWTASALTTVSAFKVLGD